MSIGLHWLAHSLRKRKWADNMIIYWTLAYKAACFTTPGCLFYFHFIVVLRNKGHRSTAVSSAADGRRTMTSTPLSMKKKPCNPLPDKDKGGSKSPIRVENYIRLNIIYYRNKYFICVMI